MRLVTGLSIVAVFCSMEIHGVLGQCDAPTVASPLKHKGTAPSYPVPDTTEVEFECETGFTLVGTNPAVCTGTTLTLPTCSNAKCPDPGTLPTGLKYKTSAPDYPIDDATTVEFECESGYTIGGTNPATCTGVTLTLPTCTATAGTCANPGTLSDGLKYKGDAPTYPIADKATVEFECEDGHTLSGTNPAVCNAGTLTLPTCTASTCPDPGTLTTGLKYKGDAPTYPIADKASVEFECDEGYTLGGTNPAVCTGGTLTLPSCTADSGSGSITVGILTILTLAIAVLAQ